MVSLSSCILLAVYAFELEDARQAHRAGPMLQDLGVGRGDFDMTAARRANGQAAGLVLDLELIAAIRARQLARLISRPWAARTRPRREAGHGRRRGAVRRARGRAGKRRRGAVRRRARRRAGRWTEWRR